VGGARLVNGEWNGTLEAAPEDGDPGARKRSRKRTAAVVEPAAEVTRQPVPSAIAEEDETLYAQHGVPRIPPAVPYIAPDDLRVPGDDLSDPDLPYWLALNRVKGIGPARLRLLLNAFGSAAEAWSADPHAWRAAGLDTRTTEALERQRPTIVPDAELERLIKLRVRALRFIDPGYPKLLSEIPLPPAILYVRGDVTSEDEWALAVVGTRRASAYGRQMTERLVHELAGQRITIVSGLVALLYSVHVVVLYFAMWCLPIRPYVAIGSRFGPGS
jgi:hypothetical protein